MKWYKLILTNDDIVANKHKIIQMEFLRTFIDANNPKGFALFDRDIRGGGDTILLSAISSNEQHVKSFIMLYPSFVECEPPIEDGEICFLAGDKSVWREVR
jgi:hypothetical protein